MSRDLSALKPRPNEALPEFFPVFVIAGPTAVGKGTILKEVLAQLPEAWLSVSATTRPPRPGEENGVAYYFLSDEEFDELEKAGGFLEHATVHGRRYGTPRQPVIDAAARGAVVILELDVAGCRQVRQSLPEAHQIFIAPPTWEDLERRLASRGTESMEERKVRLETARTELAAQGEFDVVIVNDDVAKATADVLTYMTSFR